MGKFILKKLPITVGGQASTWIIENYTSFPEYVIKKSEDIEAIIGNKFCN